MAENIKVNGLITIWRELESTLGQMVEDTKVNIKMIKSMALVSTPGKIIECTRDIGSKESSTA